MRVVCEAMTDLQLAAADLGHALETFIAMSGERGAAVDALTETRRQVLIVEREMKLRLDQVRGCKK